MSESPRFAGLAIILLLAAGCSKKEEGLLPLPFQDNFERAELGAAWEGDPGWRIRDGWLFSAGTANRPLWLKASLPDDVAIEFDARSESPDGDIKFEAFGDGRSHASGYIFILGGWKNTISCIASLDEHGDDRAELRQSGQVKAGRTYHLKLEAQGKVLRWYVDGKLFLDYFDAEPLRGSGHDRFAFNNWQSPLYFDNLSIRAAQ